MILSPSLLSADFGRLASVLQELEKAGLDWVHWDVMDGNFVPNITFGQHVIAMLRKTAPSLYFDVHLMIERPERYIEEFAKAGANMLVIHAEATNHIQRVLAEIRRQGMHAGLALNPATPLSYVENVLDDLDMVLLMSVNPGFGGQSFIPSTLDKIRRLKSMLGDRNCHIQVDGGVTPNNTKELVDAGANVLVSGSAFFNFPPFEERHQLFQNAALGKN